MNRWHHSPKHRTKAIGAYMLTGSTINKEHLFHSTESLDMLQLILMGLIERYHLGIRAWALFPNHYHLILFTYSDSLPLNSFITHFHSLSARNLNTLTNNPGRKVWFQYWDTQLTYKNSYLARLNYVMQNPVRHNIVAYAEDYRWCSAKWFKEHAEPGHYNTVTSFKMDTLSIQDDF